METKTTFSVGKTPYANDNATYGKKRADKKSKMKRPEIKPFG